jgi:NADPH:quinone reductase-like Zn-dependent oxidoreductase
MKLPDDMSALSFDAKGSLDLLKLIKRPLPRLQPGEVLVKVRAAAINHSDVKNVLGLFPYTTLPRVPGRDFAGVIVAGPERMIGRAVFGTGRPLGFEADGSHAEYVAVAADGVAAKPVTLSFTQAACCGVPYTTAHHGVVRAGVRQGSRVLVIGAGGGVGRAVMTMARARGAHVVGAVRRPAQVEALEARGYGGLILPEPDGLADAVKDVFGTFADVVYDTTGAWLRPSIYALARSGTLIVITTPDPKDQHVRFPVVDFYRRAGTLIGVNNSLDDTRASAMILAECAAGFASGDLEPPDEPDTKSLAQGLAAYSGLLSGAVGKIVLTMDEVVR